MSIRKIVSAVEKTRRTVERVNQVLFPSWIYNQPSIWDELFAPDDEQEARDRRRW